MLESTDFFLLRMPSFSINEMINLNYHIQNKDIDMLKKTFSNDLFLKAIYLSSRNFHTIAIEWLENDQIYFNNEDKVLITLYKYYSRICSRATPYGLFAGFASGIISSEATQIKFKDSYQQPKIRVDLLALKKIKDSIINNNENLKKIIYYPNNTIYNFNDIIRYIEWDKNYNCSISEIELTPLLEDILESSKSGISYDALSQIVFAKENQTTIEEVEAFIALLFQSKILVDRLPPYLTDVNDPIIELQNQLENYKINFGKSEIINNINDIILKGKVDIKKIDFLYGENKDIFNEKQQLLQVDLKFNLQENEINKKIVEKIIEASDELKCIAVKKPLNDIKTFHKRFYEKYEEQEVELTKVLDPQIGIGYGLQISGNVEEIPLLEEISFSYKNSETHEISPILKKILSKYSDYLSIGNGKPIIITKEDIDSSSINEQGNEFHETSFLFGEILVENNKNIDENNFKFFTKASLPTPNCNTVLSRFAYHDDFLKSKISTLNGDTDDVVYAEIVNSSNDRLGNVLLRPNFYQYEIPYVSETKGDKEKITINDIMISIKDNEIILRSKSLNKRIKPVMSTAYNYQNDQLSIIRFLGDLQYYNVYGGFTWSWGALSDNTYLPRIEYKEIILSEARWKIEKNLYSIQDIKLFLEQYKVPKYCNIKELDNVLLLDMENELCLNLIKSKLAKNDITLYESFIESSFIKNDEKIYTGEVIIPLMNIQKIKKIEIKAPEIQVNERFFYPGGEWSYFKLYCSHKIGDRLISEVIRPLIKELHIEESSLKWFFIRYNDPENHIRLRINKALDKDLIQRVNKYAQKFIDEKLITKIQIDSYEREIERYSGFGIEDAEKLFYFDSEAISEFLEVSEFDENENVRWMVAVASIDILMDDFSISLRDRKNIFENFYFQFLPEFVDISNKENMKEFKTSIDGQYRKYRAFFDEVINSKNCMSIEDYIHPFVNRSIRIKKIINDKSISKSDTVRFLQNYIHMSLNKFFYTKPRMYELLIYFFLFQSYKSKFLRNDSIKEYTQ